jgi:AraC-like DNA-binding protein
MKKMRLVWSLFVLGWALLACPLGGSFFQAQRDQEWPMGLFEQVRPSSSAAIDRVWYSNCDLRFRFLSYAESRSEIVIARNGDGAVTVSVRGPESVPSQAEVSPGSECIGIVFNHGTHIPSLLPSSLSNRRDVELPVVDGNHFVLAGAAWEIPTLENADTFIERLMRRGLLSQDHDVRTILMDQPAPLAVRTYQYRFLKSTGLTYTTIRQIERARQAVSLLRKGTEVQTVIHDLGYYDQSHLIRYLKRFTGLTPTQISKSLWKGSLLSLGMT